MKEEKEIIRRIIAWFKGKRVPPYCVEIWPTLKCNLNCIYCWRRLHNEPLKQQITPERYIEIVHEAGRMGVKRIEVSGGGEPLMFEKITELVKAIKSYKMIGTMTTNATLFNEELVKLFVEIKWDLIAISLDSPIKQIQDKIRGKGVYDRVIRTLKLFKSYKKRKQDLPKIILVPVISTFNYKSLPLFFELAKKFDIEAVDFKPLILYNGAYEKYRIKETHTKELVKMVNKSLMLSKKYHISTTLKNFLDEFFSLESPTITKVMEKDKKKYKQKIMCFLPWYFLKIFDQPGAYGYAGPCRVPNSFHMENINTNSLEKIWYGEKANKLRKTLLKGKIPEFCKKCCGGVLLDNRRILEELNKLGITL